MHLIFLDAEGHSLFEAVGQAVPRKGEHVAYILSHQVDRENWNKEALKDAEALRGKQFEVVRVCHEFHKSLVMKPETHLIFVTVRPV